MRKHNHRLSISRHGLDGATLGRLLTAGLLWVAAQGASAAVLLSDNFDTGGSINSDLATRQGGSLATVSYASGQFGTAGLSGIQSNQLRLNTNNSYSSNVALNHDFRDAAITSSGGFQIAFDANLSSTNFSGGNGLGLGIGYNDTSSAISGFPAASPVNDIGFRLFANGTAYYRTAGGSGTFTFDAGAAANDVFHMVLQVATADFNSGTTAAVSLFVDGNLIDMNGAAAGEALTFAWDGNANYIGMNGLNSVVLVDNLEISDLSPEASVPVAPSALLMVAGLAVMRGRRRDRS